MRTQILVSGEVLSIQDAHGTVVDDFGYSWVCVKGEEKAWHFRVPPRMGHTQEEYDKFLEKAEMSAWHKDIQKMLQKMYPAGELEYFDSRIDRRADFKTGNRVFEVQYSDVNEDVILGKTRDWNSLGIHVTWILHTNLLSPVKYQPHTIWHGEQISTANFPTKTLCKWFKPLELNAVVMSVQPLFEWGGYRENSYGHPGITLRKDTRDYIENTGESALYRFYDAKYNEEYKNYTVSGGVTFNWAHAFNARGGRMYDI